MSRFSTGVREVSLSGEKVYGVESWDFENKFN